MVNLLKQVFSSSHTWVVIAAFVIGGLTFVDHFLPVVIGAPLDSILGILAISLHLNATTTTS